jgi:hypothetical protein
MLVDSSTGASPKMHGDSVSKYCFYYSMVNLPFCTAPCARTSKSTNRTGGTVGTLVAKGNPSTTKPKHQSRKTINFLGYTKLCRMRSSKSHHRVRDKWYWYCGKCYLVRVALVLCAPLGRPIPHKSYYIPL